MSNVNDYNDDDGWQTLRRNNNCDDYNDATCNKLLDEVLAWVLEINEDSVRSFGGTNVLSIRAWIEEFEETAAVMGWDELQRFVFAQKSLKGVAKLFSSSEKEITYDRLKNALFDEFETCASSIQQNVIRTQDEKRWKCSWVLLENEGISCKRQYWLKFTNAVRDRWHKRQRH